jgi:hypothetical protein
LAWLVEHEEARVIRRGEARGLEKPEEVRPNEADAIACGNLESQVNVSGCGEITLPGDAEVSQRHRLWLILP